MVESKISEEEIVEAVINLSKLLCFTVVLGPIALTKWALKNSFKLLSLTPNKRYALGLLLLTAGVLGVYFSYKLITDLFYQGLFIWLSINSAGLGVMTAFAPLWLKRFISDRVEVEHTENEPRDFNELVEKLYDKDAIPVGVSLKDHRVMTLPLEQFTRHTIICGSTGEGKTSSMKAMLKHAFIHGDPVIIIDPKGSETDIEEIRNYAIKYGKLAEEFKLFSLARPEQSKSYNPLKYGTPEQKKTKVVNAFNLNHEYYGSVARDYVGTLSDVFSFLGREFTLRALEEALINQRYFAGLEQELRGARTSEKVNLLISSLNNIKTYKKDEKAGLLAQLRSINSLEFGDILSPKKSSENQISLEKVINNGEIAYFQLNVNGYEDMARAVGRLLIQDIKNLSSGIETGHIRTTHRICHLFVDEFGSFATNSFADLLKMARSSRIAIHMLFQSLGDLDRVGEGFRSQILNNAVQFILYRQNMPEEVELWAKMAGTIASTKTTYRVDEKAGLDPITGMGSQRDVDITKINFNVLKVIKRGQAVIIDKGQQKRFDIVKFWNE
jgi:hypothetical protein|tara:strand:+ start:3484 stop:5148 length:1665 start_codon:yes stop_codon:yes gene_type:complete